jgi:RimJ/RimL family protein N-acetyltransferase
MHPDLQPTLENATALLKPLQQSDFEALYGTASDPKIWEQHPNKDRWRRDVFSNFFKGAMESGGAFMIIDKATGEIAGSTRFYNYNETEKSILIGYTFYAVKFWGAGLNPLVKRLMMDYIFQFVDKVHFHIGATNIRSQVAIQRLGAQKIAEETVAYYGESPKLNFVYESKRTSNARVS